MSKTTTKNKNINTININSSSKKKLVKVEPIEKQNKLEQKKIDVLKPPVKKEVERKKNPIEKDVVEFTNNKLISSKNDNMKGRNRLYSNMNKDILKSQKSFYQNADSKIF